MLNVCVASDIDRESEVLLENLSYYLEGVTQTTLAFAGVLCNIIVCFVLASKEMRNSFNLMLVALAIFDSGKCLLAPYNTRERSP